MKFFGVYFFLMMILLSPLFAQPSAEESDEFRELDEQLTELFRQRKQLYDEARKHYSRNSAIFGGKSKNDLRTIIQDLEQIIEKDNRIISTIEKQRDVREQEKSQSEYMNYSLETAVSKVNQRTLELERANLNLQKQVTQKENRLIALEESLSKAQQQRGLFILLSVIAMVVAVLAAVGYFRGRKKRGVAEQ